jgi:signal transduction histidine kinase
VYSQAGILVHLVKNFALMSNLEADEQLGQMRNQEPTDLMLVAINLANDFQPQAAEAEKKIVVDDASFRGALGRRKMLIEKNLVAQALSNLLENAVKYGDSHTTITVRGRSSSGEIEVSVTSIGLRIEEGEKGRIFERSFRGAAAKQKVATGTGIGLYLASRVMSLHEGKIAVDIRGNEARFSLLFPTTRLR